MSLPERTPTSIGVRKKRRTVHIVRLVRKTSVGKMLVVGITGLLVGGGVGFFGARMLPDEKYELAVERVGQEYRARVHAEELLSRKTIELERMIARHAQQSEADLSRMNVEVPNLSQNTGEAGDLQTTAGSNPEAVKEWKSRYRYAAIKFNKLAADYSQLHKKYLELTGAGGATKGIVTGQQFYRFLRNENKQKLDHCWEEKKKSLRLGDRKIVEENERLYTDRDSWLRRMAIRIGIEKV